MTKKIRVVVKNPGEKAEVREIEDSLENLQKLVGGYIEWYSGIFPAPFGLYLNEEGKLNGMQPNIVVPHDIIVGPVVACSTTIVGDNASLTEDEAERISYILNGLGGAL